MKTYLIKCEESGLIKIGKTKNMKARLSMLQTGSSSKLKLIHVFDEDIEKALHLKFKSSRKKGEWFDVNPHHVISFAKKLTTNEVRGSHKVRSINMDQIKIGDLVSVNGIKSFVQDTWVNTEGEKWHMVDNLYFLSNLVKPIYRNGEKVTA